MEKVPDIETDMPTSDDTAAWLAQLQEGDPQAAQVIWERYFDKLVRQAQRKLAGFPRRVVDEEDVALSAMNSFMEGARAGRFPQLEDEHGLWPLLLKITNRKVTAQRRRQRALKRGGGHVRGESALDGEDGRGLAVGLEQVQGHDPTPQFAAQVAEQCRLLLDELADPTLHDVACWKMEGYTNEEIAARLGRKTRTVERKLALIRECWAHHA